MKKNITRAATMIFFAAVIIVSAVLILNQTDEDSIETNNTIPEEYRTDTDILPEDGTSDTTRRPVRDLDIGFEYTSSAPDSLTSESTAEDMEITVTAPPADGTGTSSATTSRTVITSRARKEYDSNSVYIDIENILQNPELPVGCEITALTILLRHYGFNAEKTDMAKNYLPTSWGNSKTVDGKVYKDSFFDYFIGDPFSKGYGCFSPAIEKAANKYISANGGGYTVKNISGCHPDVLYEYLIAGTPVLCWATDGMIEPEYYETWYDNATGDQLDWYLNEHCFVLAGFNISASTVTLNDPMKGIIDYNIDKFEVRFKQMYSQAIVIIPDGAGVSAETVTTASSVNSETVTESVWVTENTSRSDEGTSAEMTEEFSETGSEITEETTVTTVPPYEEDDNDTGFFTGSFIY